MTGDRIGRQLSLATRRELIQAIAERYHSAARPEKKKILDEFIQVTGYHRKHAIRALRNNSGIGAAAAPRSRIYNEEVRHALTILWEAADRICGKRLKEAIPTLVDAMERYGVWSKNPIRMKSKDDGSKEPGGLNLSVTPRYMPRNHRVTSARRLRNQPDNISCFQRNRVFGPHGERI